jgi:DNA processing protein
MIDVRAARLSDDEDGAAVALLARPNTDWRRLGRWRDDHGGYAAALRATSDDPDGEALRATRCVEARGAFMWRRGRDDWPVRSPIEDEPEVLLAEGERADAIDRPRVAIVGTRAATPHGIADARSVAAALASAGCTIVSGLAIGIDGAAHEGALDAGGLTIAVVATGVDRVYPRRHDVLTARVRAQGLVLGETWYGVAPAAWRFPVRNRVIAALADIVVVIEATRSGGANITARLAAPTRPVLVQPGSRRNPAAAGCNQMIQDGAHPLLCADDVLVALGLTPVGQHAPLELPPVDHPHAAAVQRALGGEPATIDELRDRTGLEGASVAGALRAMERAGRVTRSRGMYWPS